MKVKRLFNFGMAMMLLVTSFAVSQPVAAEAPMKFTPRIPAGAEYVPGEVVVTFADTQEKTLVEKIEQAVETASDAGGEVTRLSMDGSAVIQVEGDTAEALAELNEQPGVLFAELNYVYSVPTAEAEESEETNLTSDYVFREVTPSVSTNGRDIMAVPHSTIQGMVAMGTLPSDTYLTINQAWQSVGADIVWQNATPSANICQVDTGVDYAHPDLGYSYTVVKVVNRVRRTYTYYAYRAMGGYDFVNADADVMDDNGHGTHVAGIMVAMGNNAQGISGVSTGSVIAVKALDAQGTGTNFDIAKAIKYCADRTDVRVINLSLGGDTESLVLKNALLYATTPTDQIVPGNPAYPGCAATNSCVFGKGKLVVVAAGNKNDQVKTWPAAYAVDPAFNPAFPALSNRILSVGATGKASGGDIDYTCKANTSKFGDWVTVAAPGYDIYSTTPYDKPFYENYYGLVNTRYDYMSGTSMAAAFVSAAAARRMGYKPAETNETVGTLVRTSGNAMKTTCTPNEMLSVKRVNVATLLDRAGIRLSVFDALSGVPLNGASVAVLYTFNGATAVKFAVIAPDIYKPLLGEDIDSSRILTYYQSVVDLLDVPTMNANGTPVSNYILYVNKPGYTNGYQQIFREFNTSSLGSGTFNVFMNGSVPPMTNDFNVVLGWNKWQQVLNPNTNPPTLFKEANYSDLDLYVWLPDKANPTTETVQPAPFIVGYLGDAIWNQTYVDGDSYGSMTDFPFARLKREGGYLDGGPTVEATSILYRAPRTGGTVAANVNVPYWAGAYTVMATDYGQTIDHDNDGCGDNYGNSFSSSYDATADADCPPNDAGGTLGIPLLGAYYTPYAYVWKGGVVTHFVSGANGFGPWAAETTTDLPENCNDHWWKAFEIFSTTLSTAPAYTSFATAGGKALCDDGLTPPAGFIPYAGYTNGMDGNDRLYISGYNK